MTLAPLLNAVQPIPPHTILAFAAVVIGGLQLLMPKGTHRHLLMGSSWVGLLAFVAMLKKYINVGV